MELCRGGKCGLFGEGGLIMFDVNQAKPAYGTPDLLVVIFLGSVGGILGSLYNYLVDKVLRTYTMINEYAPQIPYSIMKILVHCYILFSPLLHADSNTNA